MVNLISLVDNLLNFDDVTIKDIAELTSFTRPSTYNYFETREEIFLGLLEREYQLWAADLRACQPVTGKDPKRQFARAVAGTLAEHGTMLRLLANNLMEIESNSRMERLIGFKRVYGESIEALGSCLSRFCPEMTSEEVDGFVSCYVNGMAMDRVLSSFEKRKLVFVVTAACAVRSAAPLSAPVWMYSAPPSTSMPRSLMTLPA